MDEKEGDGAWLRALRVILAVGIFLAELYVVVEYPQIELSIYMLAFPYILIAPAEVVVRLLTVGRGK